MENAADIDIHTIVDSLSDGVYVCDLERRITYWSKSAERITGWTADDVVGRQCFDDEILECAGFPLAVVEDAEYDEVRVPLQAGDRLLFFSDGALEMTDSAGKMLGIDGLIVMLQGRGYPAHDLQMDALEEDLLKYSNAIRLGDDLTPFEVHFVGD